MDNLLDTFKSLGTVRLAAIGGVAIGLIVFFVFLTSRLGGNDMTLLFGELEGSDSSQIVSKLETMKIPYELRAGGQQVFVPSQQVLRLRMQLAEEGLPTGGSVGYEIFDKSDSLGTTNFVQNVNLLRALEGELSRTIRALAQVDEARVHLVMPKRELFSRREQSPSASVVLKTRGAGQLNKAQVLAIQHLVAAAVPRLEPERISIIDSRGRLLARAGNEDADGAVLATNADEMRRAYEERLTRQIEQLVEQSVGFGKVRAQVAAEMNFDRITTNTEAYDPDGQVVRSTQTIEESAQSNDGDGQNAVTVANNLPDAQQNAGGGAGSASLSNRTEETVNYEITRTVKNHVHEAGTLRRVSVAILVDGTYKNDGNGSRVYAERDKAELDKIESLVKSAIGFDKERGDTVEVISMRFRALDEQDLNVKPPLFGLTKTDLFRIAEIFVLAVVGILVILLVVRPLVARTLDALPSALESAKEQALLADQSEDAPALEGPSGTGVSASFDDEEEDQLINLDQVDGRVKASTLKKISEIVERHPEETVGILRQWMYQES